MRNLKSFWLLLVLAVLGSSSAVAQLTQGKVYNFKNVGYQKSLAAWSFTQVGHAITDDANKAQHW
ncbi:MAG: hypothetical protein J6R91_03835, partial [Bacteroidaceae bacterium]|nr:hypothetical protein [Bacteroidaceae bacterium]